MAFTTTLFLFIGLPVTVSIYYLISMLKYKVKDTHFINRYRLDDVWLVLINSVFYSWALTSDVYRFWIYIIFVYMVGCAIHYYKEIPLNHDNQSSGLIRRHQVILAMAIIIVLIILINFKYTEIFAGLINWLLKTNFKGHNVIAPLGISFITFSAISYLTDISCGKAKKGNLIDFALYMSFFPKVVSGTIVLWRDFKIQTKGQRVTLDDVSNGTTRIMIGFAKKLILIIGIL